MTGGRSPRRKGDRREREFAGLINGQRVPLSGAVDGYPGDVTALGLTWECKARADGFRQLYAWLDNADALPDACSVCGSPEIAGYTVNEAGTGEPRCGAHYVKPTDGPLVRYAVEELGLPIVGRTPGGEA